VLLVCKGHIISPQALRDHADENNFAGCERLDQLGRFVGSRFIDENEKRKAKDKPNRMFAANHRAVVCLRTAQELAVAAHVYHLLVLPVLRATSGHGLLGITSQLELGPLLKDIIAGFSTPASLLPLSCLSPASLLSDLPCSDTCVRHSELLMYC
jgi:hypothetical protein